MLLKGHWFSARELEEQIKRDRQQRRGELMAEEKCRKWKYQRAQPNPEHGQNRKVAVRGHSHYYAVNRDGRRCREQAYRENCRQIRQGVPLKPRRQTDRFQQKHAKPQKSKRNRRKQRHSRRFVRINEIRAVL